MISEKVPVVFVIIVLYIVIGSLPASLADYAANSKITMYGYFSSANKGVILILFAWSRTYRLWSDMSLVFVGAR